MFKPKRIQSKGTLRWEKEIMDFNALQHKLFELDPSDPKEDLRKLAESASGNAQKSAEPAIDYVQESAEVAEGSLQMDRDYSVNDFAALAGVQVNEGAVDSFKAGFKNYNQLDALKKGASAMDDGSSSSTEKTPATSKTSKPTKISDLSKGDSFKDERGMVWYYNPNQQNWQSKDRRQKLSPEEGFKRWMKSASPRKRNVKEDQIEALESRVAYLESVIETLIEGKQKTGSAGQAKGKDPMPSAKPGRTKHPLKDKLVGEEYKSIKEELWAKLNAANKS